MDSDSTLYSAIGETSRTLHEACDMLIGIVGKVRKSDAQSVAAFMVPGPEGSKYPWMVLVGPGPAMCEHATTSAREYFEQIKAHFLDEQRFTREDS